MTPEGLSPFLKKVGKSHLDFMLGFSCAVIYKVDVLILRDTWCGKIHLCHVVAPSSKNMF